MTVRLTFIYWFHTVFATICKTVYQAKLHSIWKSLQFFKVTAEFPQIWDKFWYVTSWKHAFSPNCLWYTCLEHEYSYYRIKGITCVSLLVGVLLKNPVLAVLPIQVDVYQKKSTNWKSHCIFGCNNYKKSSESRRVWIRISFDVNLELDGDLMNW